MHEKFSTESALENQLVNLPFGVKKEIVLLISLETIEKNNVKRKYQI